MPEYALIRTILTSLSSFSVFIIHLRFKKATRISDNYTHQSAITVIDNLLHRILQLSLALIIDHCHFIPHTIHHQILHRFTKDIGIPNTIFLTRHLMNISDQILCLLFISYNRCDLRLNICLDQMN